MFSLKFRDFKGHYLLKDDNYTRVLVFGYIYCYTYKKLICSYDGNPSIRQTTVAAQELK